jgi:hippurate hydrolase
MSNSFVWKALFGAFLFFCHMNQGFSQSISSISDERYRYLHSHPELSGQETNTAQFLKSTISELGYSIVDSLGFHSFAAVLENGKGPAIMYRTDMDALPLKEQTGAPFAPMTKDMSNEPVVGMHACGHDLHMTTWLEVAEYMIKNKKTWKGTLIFLAQSSEETGQGARAVLASKNFKKIPVSNYQIAFHNTPELASGTVGFCDQYAFASVDMMNITIKGKGGHGAEPFRAVDPVLLSAYFITEIQSIVSRNLPPNDPAVITVGAINGGTVGNIIPSEVTLKLTIRSYSKESRKVIFQRLKEIGNGLAASAGLDSSYYPNYDLLDMSIPPVFNNPEIGKILQEVMLANQIPTAKMSPKMIGEDFGVYGQELNNKSYMLWIGTRTDDLKKCPEPDSCVFPKLHTSSYLPDYKSTIPIASKAMSKALLSLLNH